MAWITLTEADVKTRLAGAELTAYKGSAVASGITGAEILEEILEGTIREVRGRVAACDRNELGDGLTIPDELRHHALAIVVYRLITRLPLPATSPLVEQRRAAYDDAQEALDKVAKCEFAIEQPTTVSSEVTAGGSSVVLTQRTNKVTGSSLGSL